MPLTALDTRTALVLIDLQHGAHVLVDPQSLAGPLARAGELAAAFRARGLPVVLVRVNFAPDWADAPRNRTSSGRPGGQPPANWAELLPELDRQPTDVLVTKHQAGAFHGTDLGRSPESCWVAWRPASASRAPAGPPTTSGTT